MRKKGGGVVMATCREAEGNTGCIFGAKKSSPEEERDQKAPTLRWVGGGAPDWETRINWV